MKKSLEKQINALEVAIKSPATSPAHRDEMEAKLKILRESEKPKAKTKSEKKTVHVNGDRAETIEKAGIVLMRELDDIGIDLEGEEETIVAGTRLELDDALRLGRDVERAIKIEEIVKELDESWLSDIKTASAKKMIKSSIKKFWNSVGKWPMDKMGKKSKSAIKDKKPKKKSLSKEDCTEAIKELEQRRKKFKSSERKYRTKPISEKVGKNIATSVKLAVDNIPAEKFRDDPKEMFSKIEKLEKSATEFFADFRSILGEDYDKSDAKESFDKIGEQIASLKKKYEVKK